MPMLGEIHQSRRCLNQTLLVDQAAPSELAIELVLQGLPPNGIPPKPHFPDVRLDRGDNALSNFYRLRQCRPGQLLIRADVHGFLENAKERCLNLWVQAFNILLAAAF